MSYFEEYATSSCKITMEKSVPQVMDHRLPASVTIQSGFQLINVGPSQKAAEVDSPEGYKSHDDDHMESIAK